MRKKAVLLVVGLALAIGLCGAMWWRARQDVVDAAFRTAEMGDVAALKAIVARDPSVVAARDSYQQTLLHVTVLNGHRYAAAYLLEAGADPNARNSLGLTPLHLAAQDGLGFLVRLLTRRGALVDVQDDQGMTPLHWAAHVGCATAVKALLNSGADRTIKNNAGETPVDVARKAGHTHVFFGHASEEDEEPGASRDKHRDR